MKSKTMATLVLASSVLAVPYQAMAAGTVKCDHIRWREGNVLSVKSALYSGTRIEFPSRLVAEPANSNPDLWDMSSAANQLMLKPNSETGPGSSTVIHAFTEDGNVYDIVFTRSEMAKSDLCVTIDSDSRQMSNGLRDGLNSQSVRRMQNSAEYQGALKEAQQGKKEAVSEALRLYRYHIYTRYTWDTGSGFSGKNIISDVYDDGRWTYIRVANNNKGVFSVISKVGGKEAVIPYEYDDSYGIYRISGIYPEFTLKLNDSTVKVERSDNQTKGES